MIYTILNPYTGQETGTRTELNSETGYVWHIPLDGCRTRSEYNFEYWVRALSKLGITLDQDYEVDEGL